MPVQPVQGQSANRAKLVTLVWESDEKVMGAIRRALVFFSQLTTDGDWIRGMNQSKHCNRWEREENLGIDVNDDE